MREAGSRWRSASCDSKWCWLLDCVDSKPVATKRRRRAGTHPAPEIRLAPLNGRTQHDAICVTHHDHAALRMAFSPLLYPHVKHRLQLDVRQQGRDQRALWCVFQRLFDRSIFHGAGAQPLPDQLHDPGVADPVGHKTQQPSVIYRIEEPQVLATTPSVRALAITCPALLHSVE